MIGWAVGQWLIFDSSAAVDRFAHFCSGPLNQIFITVGAIALAWKYLRPAHGYAGRAREQWMDALGSVLPIIIATIIAHILKLTIGNWLPRPSGNLGGFPSAHTITAMTIAFLIMRMYPRYAVIGFVVAAVIGWSRVQLHAHFLYQVTWGAVLGLEVPIIMDILSINRKKQSDRSTKN